MARRTGGGLTRRERYEAQQKRRSLGVAAASTVAVGLALFVLVPLAPGWEKVQQSFFNAEVLVQSFPKLLDAFKINVMIFAWSAPAIAVLGLLIALARDVKSPAHLRGPLYGYFSRRAGYSDSLPDRFWYPGAWSATSLEFALYLGVSRPDPHIFRLRGRNFPLGHRQRAS